MLAGKLLMKLAPLCLDLLALSFYYLHVGLCMFAGLLRMLMTVVLNAVTACIVVACYLAPSIM